MRFPFLVRLALALSLFLTVLPIALAAPDSVRADTAIPPAREGCMDQWMFNGLWRVKVTKADPLSDDSGKQIGWIVTEIWRNGTSRVWSPGDTFAKDQLLVLANGSTITADETTIGTLSAQDVAYHGFPPAAQYTHQQRFIAASNFDPSVKPASLIVPFDAARQAQRKDAPQYTIKPAAYKVKLDCQATAQQQAQGGAYELAAQKGCLNQWVGNGLWKIRVTKVEPEMGDEGKQVGWLVAQDWTNISGRKLTPGGTSMGDEQLVISNDDTISSGETTLTTLKEQQLNYHDFTPGATFAHVQNFRRFRPAFDPSLKPTRLIVYFDEGAYSYFSGKPFPVHPQNFRIRFDCQK